MTVLIHLLIEKINDTDNNNRFFQIGAGVASKFQDLVSREAIFQGITIRDMTTNDAVVEALAFKDRVIGGPAADLQTFRFARN